MALVSPGVQVTVTDEAQYLPTSIGSVPFVVIATEQDKLINGFTAVGTTKANAGKIYGITSQRELTNIFGAPVFRRSTADTPLHGDELNEYGLMAAYSALGIGNRAWVLRADIDLADLVGTSVRPRGYLPNKTNWLDLANTEWGIYEFSDALPNTDSPFIRKAPHVINTLDLTESTSPFAPLPTVGDKGDYAVVTLESSQYTVYYKHEGGAWAPVGSNAWVANIPQAVSTRTSVSAQLATTGNIAAGSTFSINGSLVTINAVVNSMAQLKSEIDTDMVGVVTPNGTIASITAATQGSGYVTAPAVTISGTGGSSATAIAVLGTGANADKVVSYTITNPGSGYTSVSISVAAEVKTTATATATLTAGAVTSITVTGQGKGYLTAPTVTIGGDGNSATAVAVLGTGAQAGEIVSINVTAGGTGYSTATVTIAAPTPGSAATATGTIGTSVVGAVPGVRVTVSSLDRLQFFADPALAASTGGAVDGKIKLTDGVNSPLTRLGFFGAPPPTPTNTGVAHTGVLSTIGVSWNWDTVNQRWHQASYTFNPAAVAHAPFTQSPSWRREQYASSTPRPAGSVWVKTSAEGRGVNLVYKRYNNISNAWVEQAGKVYSSAYTAIFDLDRTGGGLNINAGSIFVMRTPRSGSGNNEVAFRVYTQKVKGQMKVTGSLTTVTLIATGQSFTLKASQLDGTISTNTCTIGTVGSSGTYDQQKAFVKAIQDQNIPNVSAVVETSGAISILHRSGGIISLQNVTGTPLSHAGFTTATPGILADIGGANGDIHLSNWSIETVIRSSSVPAADPVDGTLWYYDDAAAVDIMINDDSGWKGYRNVVADARGYNLTLTDSKGVIISASEPVSQQDGAALQSGDLWLDSGDLENYPKLYRFNRTSGTWTLINNADRVSQNGIIFADARWDTDGSTDPVTGTLPTVASLLGSNYVDQDAPDYRLYPRGTLLFNTRRSGFTVKKFVSNYFNAVSFPDLPAVPGAGAVLPAAKSTWISDIGYKSNNHPKMGKHAQRNEVVAAMKAAIDSNTDLREEGYNFNLLTAPNYPELIPNLSALNRDRGETGFIISDMSMVLPNTTNEIINYDATEIVTGTPYLAVYYPSALTNDLTGNDIAVPASHMMLRTFLYNDQVAYPWFAPAGTRRGLVDNALAIGYVDSDSGLFMRTGINNALRDTLYERRINPITLLNGVGIVAYGQKTRNSAGSSLDRINVARLVNYLRTILGGVANQFIFEPNDKITRDQIKTVIESLLNDLVAKRGLYDYLVVCDDTNNTSDRIARNELYVDIAIEPMKAVEFIYIPIRLKNPGTIGGSAATT